MTLKRTEQLLTILRAHGVSHFKTPSVELTIGFTHPQPAVAPILSLKENSFAEQMRIPPTAAAVPPVEMPIPHHINEVAKLLKLGDNELVDALFPEGKMPPGVE